MNKRCHTALRPLLNGICRNSLVTWPRPPRVPSFCSCQQQVRLPRSRSAVPFEITKGTETSQQSAIHNVLTRINNLSALPNNNIASLTAFAVLTARQHLHLQEDHWRPGHKSATSVFVDGESTNCRCRVDRAGRRYSCAFFCPFLLVGLRVNLEDIPT